MNCDFCDGPIVPTAAEGHYGDKRACYACCAWLETIDMKAGRPIALYVTPRNVDGRIVATVGNWCGTLRLAVVWCRDGKHNLAKRRTTYHFAGPNGSTWTGTEYHGPCSGNLLRNVRRLKERWSW